MIDIGANIGQYSLFSAKLGHKVLAVEPFYDNIVRLKHSIAFNKFENNVILIGNALSNKRNELKVLTSFKSNVGAQSIIHEDQALLKEKTNKYVVETILFDDLIDFLPKGKKVIMKIDIEGYETFAFENATKIFDHVDIKCIYMEWGNLKLNHKNHHRLRRLVQFFFERNYNPYFKNEMLPNFDWLNWPWDIVWRKYR